MALFLWQPNFVSTYSKRNQRAVIQVKCFVFRAFSSAHLKSKRTACKFCIQNFDLRPQEGVAPECLWVDTLIVKRQETNDMTPEQLRCNQAL